MFSVPSSAPFARHDLAWLEPGAGAAASLVGATCLAEGAALRLLDRWLARGHPLIVTRQHAAPPGTIALGLALPPAEGKYRLAFSVPLDCVREIAPPPTLADAAEALPPDWRPTIAALLADPGIAMCRPRVYGSAAIQMLTGEACLSETSDLDLRFTPPSWPAAVALAARLQGLAQDAGGPRIDGEIWSPVGLAVAWRELAANPARLLVKSGSAVELLATTQFAAGFVAYERRAA